MRKFLGGLRKVEKAATVITMVAFTVVGFLQVFFRVFLKAPLSWSEEACRFLFVWSTMLGAVLVSTEDGHFKVELLVGMFTEKMRKIFEILSYLLIVFFSAVLIYYGYKLMMNSIRVSPAMGIRMTYIYTIFPINGILVLLHTIGSIYEKLKGIRG